MARRLDLSPAATSVLVMAGLTGLGLVSLWAGPTAGVLVGFLVMLIGLLLWRTGGTRVPSAVGLGVAASGLVVVLLSVTMWGYVVSRARAPVRPERDANITRDDPVITTVVKPASPTLVPPTTR